MPASRRGDIGAVDLGGGRCAASDEVSPCVADQGWQPPEGSPCATNQNLNAPCLQRGLPKRAGPGAARVPSLPFFTLKQLRALLATRWNNNNSDGRASRARAR